MRDKAIYLAYIFWGLLVVILDININRFDVLPDFLGYILVAVGARGLVAVSPQFSTARSLSWPLVLLSLVSLAIRGEILMALGIVNLVANCAMMWFLLGGVMVLATSLNRADLAEKASTRRGVYIALMCAATLIGLFAGAARGLAGAAAIVVVVAMVVLLVLILHLIWQVRNQVLVTRSQPSSEKQDV